MSLIDDDMHSSVLVELLVVLFVCVCWGWGVGEVGAEELNFPLGEGLAWSVVDGEKYSCSF